MYNQKVAFVAAASVAVIVVGVGAAVDVVIGVVDVTAAAKMFV
jgi:hypothetical protein